MNPAALCAWGVVAMVIMSAQAAPTGNSEKHKDIFEINQEAGLLGRACPGFKCDIDCDFGYDTDKDGCFVCSCIPEDKESMYQGDMVLGRQGKNRFLHGDSGNRAAVTSWHWPGGVVPYVIDQSIGPDGRTAITDAIADFHKHTCLRFIQRTEEEAYIKFYSGGGCSSPVGYEGYSHGISLGYGCWYKGIVIHEIMHSLGFFHEQSRPDRDDYVEIVWDNIESGNRHNFDKQAASIIDSLGTPYDYNSVMHYGKDAFGGGRVTIKTNDASKQNLIGNIQGLSDIDIKQLNLRYKCGLCQKGDGATYRGTVSVSATGKRCQRWDSQTPHGHKYTPAGYPSYGLEQNYCRNPDGHTGLWCYTTDPSTRWEDCDVPVCGSSDAPTEAPGCEDKFMDCPDWKSDCNTGRDVDIAFMEENCPVTCGTCGGSPAPTANSTASPTVASPESPTASPTASSTVSPTEAPSCEDKYGYCHSVKSYCSTQPFMEEYCTKTCGMCAGAASNTAPNADPNAEAPCEDKHPKCPQRKGHCGKRRIKKYCPMTCGTCGGDGVVPAAGPNAAPCEDKLPMCPQRKSHCGKRRVRKLCPKTCGSCARAI